MLVTGRITADASVKKLKDERNVINFSVAVNDWYKPKGSEQTVKVVTYFNCSYWINTRIAERLKKGALVELYGRVSVNAYNDIEGNAKGTLNVHVKNIKILQAIRHETTTNFPTAESITQPLEDLPF